MGKDNRGLDGKVNKTFLGGWDMSLSKYSIVKGNMRVYSVSIYLTGLIFNDVVKLNELFEGLEKEGFSVYIVDSRSASLTYNLTNGVKNDESKEIKPKKLEEIVIKLSIEETFDEKNNSYMRIKLSYENPLDERPLNHFNNKDIYEREKGKENAESIVYKAVMSILSSIEKYIKA